MGADIGKTHHHCVVLNAEGERLLWRRVLNDEPELLALLADILAHYLSRLLPRTCVRLSRKQRVLR
ncbi:IS110 family transposase [Streptomyces antimycoticus]|uniref:IS110 family transposase n=1 Tax=Streptomyces antimycoticus TaxID=68175 RepID=UPI003B97305E